MKLKLLSTCGIAVYLLAFMSCTRTADSIELLESKGTAPYQVILLINHRWVEKQNGFIIKAYVSDAQATGVILNKRWVLTSSGLLRLLPENIELKSIKVIAGDANFEESKVDISSRYRQTLMVSQRIPLQNLVLLQVAGDLYIDGVNIQRVQLPKTWVENHDHSERTFEYGFPSGDYKCQVSGWKSSEEVQRVGKVKISRSFTILHPDDYIMVRSYPFGLNQRTLTSIYKFFKKNECIRGNCRELSIVGYPLVCRESKWDPWILMGLGDKREAWDAWQNNIAPFVRVSPMIGELRAQIRESDSDLYIYQGIEGQPRKFPFQALVKVGYNNDPDNLVQVCQGVIVSARRVLTAASCFDRVNGQQVVRVAVVIGITNLNDDNQNNLHEANDWSVYNERDIDFTQWIPGLTEADYNGIYDADSDFDFYNMAVIGFQQRLPLDDYARAIDITASYEGISGCSVSGWEKMVNGQYDPHIRYRHVSVLENQRCVSPMLKPNVMEKFWNEHLCVKEREPDQIAQIDPGAPVTCYIGNQVVVVGIASFNGPLERFGGEDGPKIFTGLVGPKLTPWLTNRIR